MGNDNHGDDQKSSLDTEWIDLILEAKKIGMSIQEIQKFLNQEGLQSEKIIPSA